MGCNTTHYNECDCRKEKFKKLYIATNRLMSRIGAEGEIGVGADECDDVMDALADLDGGVFDVERVF